MCTTPKQAGLPVVAPSQPVVVPPQPVVVPPQPTPNVAAPPATVTPAPVVPDSDNNPQVPVAQPVAEWGREVYQRINNAAERVNDAAKPVAERVNNAAKPVSEPIAAWVNDLGCRFQNKLNAIKAQCPKQDCGTIFFIPHSEHFSCPQCGVALTAPTEMNKALTNLHRFANYMHKAGAKFEDRVNGFFSYKRSIPVEIEAPDNGSGQIITVVSPNNVFEYPVVVPVGVKKGEVFQGEVHARFNQKGPHEALAQVKFAEHSLCTRARVLSAPPPVAIPLPVDPVAHRNLPEPVPETRESK
jgi:ribosomal protein S27AE